MLRPLNQSKRQSSRLSRRQSRPAFSFNKSEFKAEPISLHKAEASLNEDLPGLLFSDERLDMGFRAIRNEYFFTTHRILIVEKQGITGKRAEYKSCFYNLIKAFSIESSTDASNLEFEIKIYGDSQDAIFKFDVKKVNIFAIKQYLSGHVFIDSVEDLKSHHETWPQKMMASPAQGAKNNKLLDYLKGDGVRLEEEGLEDEELQDTVGLLPNEMVELTYQCKGGMVICTSMRLVYVNVQGEIGEKVEYLSIKYDCIKAYKIETDDGSFLDGVFDFQMFTNISQDKRCIQTKMRKSQSDIMEILWYFNKQLLGMDTLSEAGSVLLSNTNLDSIENMMSCLSHTPEINAAQVDKEFRSSLPLLQGNEVCEKSFKGPNSILCFTNKRILFIVKQGNSGRKVAFTTFPYNSIKVFQATITGSLSEQEFWFGFYTEIWFNPPTCNGCRMGCRNEEPTPGMSHIETKINSNTSDLLGIHRYIDEMANKTSSASSKIKIHPNILLSTPTKTSHPDTIHNFFAYFSQDFVRMDPKLIEATLGIGGNIPVLGVGEKVLSGLKCGTNFTMFTSKKILDIEVRAVNGEHFERIRSIPYNTIRRFSTESTGSFDNEGELEVGFCTPLLPELWRLKLDKVDTIALQHLLASKTLATHEKTNAFFTRKLSDPDSMDKLIFYIGFKSFFDPIDIEKKLKREIPILETDEKVELGFKIGRRMFLITTKRVLAIDVDGLTRKKFRFTSISYKHVFGFTVHSAGNLRSTAKATLLTSKLVGCMPMEFGKKDISMLEINKSLNNKIFMHTKR